MSKNPTGFAVEIDTSRNLLTITMRDYWDIEVVNEFHVAIQTALRDMQSAKPIYVMVDTSRIPSFFS